MAIKKTRYVLHLHNAHKAGRHFDFRIKYFNEKKLISFAIPKEKLPYNVGEQALAIQTPDHSIGWLYREKLRIPKGEYGGGFIKRLQYGNCYVEIWTDTYIKFSVDAGPYMTGDYIMFMTKYMKKTKAKNPIWILKKIEKDEKDNTTILNKNIIDKVKKELKDVQNTSSDKSVSKFLNDIDTDSDGVYTDIEKSRINEVDA
jgi:hypothetical protein